METTVFIFMISTLAIVAVLLPVLFWRIEKRLITREQERFKHVEKLTTNVLSGQKMIFEQSQVLESRKLIDPIRLQAYERLLLFLERTKIEGLVMRVSLPAMTAFQLKTAIMKTIREELDHNMSQQLYVTDNTWEALLQAKKKIIDLIETASENIDKDTDSIAFASTLFKLSEKQEFKIDHHIKSIKDEMRQQFSL